VRNEEALPSQGRMELIIIIITIIIIIIIIYLTANGPSTGGSGYNTCI
jgi:hypothetical protein